MEDGTFVMTLVRTYEAGREPKRYTDVGEFPYDVERVYTGDFAKVGAKLAVAGKIHDVTDGQRGDKEVGFFNLLDTTEERLKVKE